MNRLHHDQARADYERARRRATLHALLARLRRQPTGLVPYHDARRRHALHGERHLGVRAVPVALIVGSTDRCRDFDRAFRPLGDHTAARWQSVARADAEGTALPPVQLYRLGDAYFVRDGHHRVSVARARGRLYVDAEVVEARVAAPLAAPPPAETGVGAAGTDAARRRLRRRLALLGSAFSALAAWGNLGAGWGTGEPS